eukprot:TRINITY_DN7791_c0_g1_i1.p4 TRINITY_DN7791_c0_g1~~TRINITY_DN7791_c0_g1_i1.p4  ORF type:complete len:143 (-),score=9.62 TRINITY_DN7791_c0_g1_i1:140-568(-)
MPDLLHQCNITRGMRCDTRPCSPSESQSPITSANALDLADRDDDDEAHCCWPLLGFKLIGSNRTSLKPCAIRDALTSLTRTSPSSRTWSGVGARSIGGAAAGAFAYMYPQCTTAAAGTGTGGAEWGSGADAAAHAAGPQAGG